MNETIPIAELESLITKTLRKKYDEEDTQRIKDVILFGELSGKTTHGIVRLFIGNSSVMAQSPTAKPFVKRRTKISSVIEGNLNPGTLVGPIALEETIRLAKENGFGIVGTHGSNSSSGCLAYYLEKMTNENLIGLVMAQSPKSTVAFGGIEPLFGTNPLSFGIPSRPLPILFDMATSAISFGAMLKAKELGQKLPDHVAIDSQGNPTTDPELAIQGATLAFDNSYKGSGLAMMVEILSGLWPGADFVGKNPVGKWGNTFMAFSPDLLMDYPSFVEKMQILTETVRHSKTKNGSPIRIPGEQPLIRRNQCLEKGMVTLEEKLLTELRSASS